jgi:hypothetical protein
MTTVKVIGKKLSIADSNKVVLSDWYVIYLPIPRTINMRAVEGWADRTCTGRYHTFRNYWWFENEEDVSLFKLKWG